MSCTKIYITLFLIKIGAAFEISYHNSQTNKLLNNNSTETISVLEPLKSIVNVTQIEYGASVSSDNKDFIPDAKPVESPAILNNNLKKHCLDQLKQQKNYTELDLSDFIAIIPIDDVRQIFENYFQQDREIQRAYEYLESEEFYELKCKIINIPEVKECLQFLMERGFDLFHFTEKLIDLIGKPKALDISALDKFKNETEDYGTVGLHGLIDNVLDILPQDQIISVFFDKFETDEKFSNFVADIGSDEFNHILSNIKNSNELKRIIYILHNNGIYITRIADSLKDYFFL